MSQNYRPFRSSARQYMASLSPRRRMNIQKLLDFCWWHGQKIYADEKTLALLADEQGLDVFDTKSAIDDAFAIGVVNVSLTPRGCEAVVPLVQQIEEAA